MKRMLWIILLVVHMTIPVHALDIAPPPIPDEIESVFPQQQENFGEGLWHILKSGLDAVRPQTSAAVRLCLGLLGTTLVLALIQSVDGKSKSIVTLAGVSAVGCMLLDSTGAMIALGTETVQQISQYGKLLLPVMTAALAAQGGITGSAALYTATALFDAVLSALIAAILVPTLYIYLVFSVVNAATDDGLLKKLKDLIKWGMSWALKIILYIFTGYISITGVISGTADQSAVKVTKLAISGMVPVVGGILSDTSETVLVSAGIVKNAAGIYGLLAVIALTVVPFLRIGVQYLLLKCTAAISSVFAPKALSSLVEDFSGAMGLLLGMTGAVCLMQMISIVCFLKGMG